MDKNIINDIDNATQQFREMLIEQYERNQAMAQAKSVSGRADGGDNATTGAASDSGNAHKLVIGTAAGDGIGPVIMKETREVLEKLLAEEIEAGVVELREIEGFTIERRLALGETVPADVLEQMLACDLILKGPTTTPNAAMVAASGGRNLESANVFLRKKLDLFANVRPVSVPEKGIDWTFFRENTEGEYALGSRGIRIGDDLSVDFKVTTREGSERIARAAYEFARENGKKRVSIVTKANIMKKTDGDFQGICLKVAEEYPEIETDCWFVDIMAANLVNEDIRSQFEVFVLPNLYGDIITDEAAQIQGGVGTAGSANIGSRYSVFEAIHGSAPRMVEEGIADRANPASLMTAAVMMLRQAGTLSQKAARLEKAIAVADEKLGVRMTGLADGASCREFTEEVLAEI